MTEQQAEAARTQTIARLNDLFRQTLSPELGLVLLTRLATSSDRSEEIIRAVQAFDAFTFANDPHGEHDFGKVSVGGESWFFKIDYYDPTLTHWQDPLEDGTIRVLTIMHTEEY